MTLERLGERRSDARMSGLLAGQWWRNFRAERADGFSHGLRGPTMAPRVELADGAKVESGSRERVLGVTSGASGEQ